MKISYFILLTLVSIFNLKANGQDGYNLNVGFPSGYMDVSINGNLFYNYSITNQFNFSLKFQESFSPKGDGGKGYLVINNFSTFLLFNYQFDKIFKDFIPIISLGHGFHYLYSVSSKKSTLGKKSKSFFTSKNHLFGEIDYLINERNIIDFSIRFTHPSEYLIDTFNIGFKYFFK